MNQPLTFGDQNIGASASASVLPMNIQGWFPSRLTGLICLQYKELSRLFSSTTVWKHQFFGADPSLWSNSHICTHLYMTTGKIIAFTISTFVSKVMSLLFNVLSRFVTDFLLRSKCLNFMVAVTVHSDFGAQESKICHCFYFISFYLPWSGGTRCHDLSFFECWVLCQHLNSPLSPSSRGNLLFLFPFCH